MTSQQVKAWRKAKGLTQEQAADWLGISWRQFQRLESGDSKVSGPIARLLYVDAPL
jgi:DNA-binding transcriptional regulator YiaG